MSENILVVEYEPRYTDRVRQALVGQPFTPTFAKDGEEAIRAIDQESPRLIVLSSVVPKISTTELIRAIRGRKPLQETPILLTVSGYNGKSPKADAQRVGASDILPKPYSENEFLGKVQQMLGIRSEGGAIGSAQLTSNEIFGDILAEDKPARKTVSTRSSPDVDKMLADTLAGMMPKRREGPAPAPPPASAPHPDPSSSAPATGSQTKVRNSGEYDRMLSDTLSGLEKSARMTSTGTTPRPAAAAPRPAPAAPPPPPSTPAPPEVPPRFNTEKMSAYTPDRVPVSQPVFTPAAPEPARLEEEEPADGVKFGQYVLVEKIATGGMAEVWKARMRGVEGFQKIVAIKKILPHLSDNQDFIEMFIDEAKLAAQLNHNNIIHIYDLGKIQSSYYIAMEYIDGFDLKTILRRGQERDHPMTVELALFVASKIASALDYAHRKKDFEEREMGLVHRDVSPQNVLISQEGDIKLCDFGIAKAASKASHTQAGALKGKLQYMSPEQAWGRHIDRRSDVFALATVLFEMLTGRKLFTGDNELSILEQVREARVQPPSDFNDEVTADIDQIVLKALHKDPALRYQTAGEMARDIDAILYSFKPTPTSADLAIYMHRLSTQEPVIPHHQEPAVEAFAPAPAAIASPVALASTAAAATPAPFEPAMATPAAYGDIPAPVKRKSSTGLIAAIFGAVIVIGGVVAFVLMPKSEPATPAAGSAVTAKTSAPAPVPAAAAVPGQTATTATTGTASTSTPPVLDPSLVDKEVQRRLDEERKRLEARAQQQASAQTVPPAATTRPAPAPQVTQTAPASAPPPTQDAPVPEPAQQTPQPAADTRPAAQQPAPAPAAPRAREGDLVSAGTPGLIPPRLVRRGTATYPSIARVQKIEGTVITSVLVSETGQVLEVRILRGINRPVGLNEAAEQAMRRSSFAPAMKDGVRVRSWLTVPVEFKL
jgi:TonB family protein